MAAGDDTYGDYGMGDGFNPVQDFGGGGGYDEGEDDDTDPAPALDLPTATDSTTVYATDDAPPTTTDSTTVYAMPDPPIQTETTGIETMVGYSAAGFSGSVPATIQTAPQTPIWTKAPASGSPGNTNTRSASSPTASNASTLYGPDESTGNNYGLGSSAPSVAQLAAAQQAQAAQPSMWWLLAAIAVIWMVA